MFTGLIGTAVGIVIGWNVLPQPAIVKKLWDKLFNKEKEEV